MWAASFSMSFWFSELNNIILKFALSFIRNKMLFLKHQEQPSITGQSAFQIYFMEINFQIIMQSIFVILRNITPHVIPNEVRNLCDKGTFVEKIPRSRSG